MDTKLTVLKKGGVSYLEIAHYYASGYRINGVEPTPCPGNKGWVMVEGDVRSVDRVIPPANELIGFKLKVEYEGLSELPKTLPKEVFEWDSEECEWVGERSPLYEPTYQQTPSGLQPVEFEVVDYDCEPVAMPEYVTVDFPNNLRFYRAVQHKYPCHVKYDEVFKLVAEAVVDATKKHPGLYEVTDYRNIQLLAVSVLIEKPPVQVRKKDLWSKRPKWTTVTETHAKRKVLDIVGNYKSENNSERIVAISGENYADLLKKLGAYIQGFVDRIDPRKWCLCSKCSGEGVVLAE